MGAHAAYVFVEGPAVPYLPTAMQAQSDTHVSAVSWVDIVPWLGGCDTADQMTPFHSRAEGTGVGPAVAAWEPTALHEVALKQSIPESDSAPLVSCGMPGSIVHCVPFQLSIRLWFGLPAIRPTAWHQVFPTHDTLVRLLPAASPVPMP